MKNLYKLGLLLVTLGWIPFALFALNAEFVAYDLRAALIVLGTFSEIIGFCIGIILLVDGQFWNRIDRLEAEIERNMTQRAEFAEYKKALFNLALSRLGVTEEDLIVEIENLKR